MIEKCCKNRSNKIADSIAAGTPIFVAFACAGEGSISERLSSGCLMALFVFTSGSHANKTLHVQHKLRNRGM
jgi:hypothetical protein